MHRTKSTDPADRMGVYKRLADVPEQFRLSAFEGEYAGRDVWATFSEDHEYDQGSSENFRRAVDRVGRHWREHMVPRKRHHALASPEDVEAWCAALIASKSRSTSYNYWVRVRRFYDWLQWHVDHPHRYNPVMMAVLHGEASGDIWEQMLDKWRRARGAAFDDD